MSPVLRVTIVLAAFAIGTSVSWADEPTTQPTSMPTDTAPDIVGHWQQTGDGYVNTFEFAADGALNIEHAWGHEIGFSWGAWALDTTGIGVHELAISIMGDDGEPLEPVTHEVVFEGDTMTWIEPDGESLTYTRILQ